MIEKQGKILIVEDEAPIRKLLHSKLSSEGYQCWEAGGAEQALAKLRNNAVGLVILDIKMPGLDGFQVLEHIRQRSNIPVIMLTVIRDVHTVRDSLGLGADDYIGKPFKTRELLARIQAKLRRAETAS